MYLYLGSRKVKTTVIFVLEEEWSLQFGDSFFEKPGSQKEKWGKSLLPLRLNKNGWQRLDIPQESNELIPKIAIFKGSYLFQGPSFWGPPVNSWTRECNLPCWMLAAWIAKVGNCDHENPGWKTHPLTGSTIRTLLDDKINPKDCQVKKPLVIQQVKKPLVTDPCDWYICQHLVDFFTVN